MNSMSWYCIVSYYCTVPRRTVHLSYCSGKKKKKESSGTNYLFFLLRLMMHEQILLSLISSKQNGLLGSHDSCQR